MVRFFGKGFDEYDRFYEAFLSQVVQLQKKGVPLSPLIKDFLDAPGNADDMNVAVKRENKVFTFFSSKWSFSGTPWALFDHTTDPEERENLFSSCDREHQATINDLQRYKQKLTVACQNNAQSEEKKELDREEKIKRLKALGYL